MSRDEQALLAMSANLADICDGLEELTEVVRLLTALVEER